MKLICVLITVLISTNFCDVYLGRNDEKTISPSVETPPYFYIKLDEFKSYDTIYVSIKIKNGVLSDNIFCMYANIDTNQSDFQIKSSYGITSYEGGSIYYYKFDYKNYPFLYIMYKLSSFHTGTRLTFKTYDSDPLSSSVVILLIAFGIITSYNIYYYMDVCKM